MVRVGLLRTRDDGRRGRRCSVPGKAGGGMERKLGEREERERERERRRHLIRFACMFSEQEVNCPGLRADIQCVCPMRTFSLDLANRDYSKKSLQSRAEKRRFTFGIQRVCFGYPSSRALFAFAFACADPEQKELCPSSACQFTEFLPFMVVRVTHTSLCCKCCCIRAESACVYVTAASEAMFYKVLYRQSPQKALYSGAEIEQQRDQLRNKQLRRRRLARCYPARLKGPLKRSPFGGCVCFS